MSQVSKHNKKQLIHFSNNFNIDDSYQHTTEDETYPFHNMKHQFKYKEQETNKQIQTATTQSHNDRLIFVFVGVVVLDVFYIFNIYLYFIPFVPLGVIAYIIFQSNKSQNKNNANNDKYKCMFEEETISSIDDNNNNNSFHPFQYELTQSFLDI